MCVSVPIVNGLVRLGAGGDSSVRSITALCDRFILCRGATMEALAMVRWCWWQRGEKAQFYDALSMQCGAKSAAH